MYMYILIFSTFVVIMIVPKTTVEINIDAPINALRRKRGERGG